MELYDGFLSWKGGQEKSGGKNVSRGESESEKSGKANAFHIFLTDPPVTPFTTVGQFSISKMTRIVEVMKCYVEQKKQGLI